MIATPARSSPEFGADSEAPGRAETLLVEQLAVATREFRLLEAGNRRTDVVRAVIRSLRKTLSWMAEHGCVLAGDAGDFVLQVSPQRELELWQGGRRIPVFPHPLREAFETAGVRLEPGQLLLVDRDLSRRILEESLVACSLEELRLREKKSALLRAFGDFSGAPHPSPASSCHYREAES